MECKKVFEMRKRTRSIALLRIRFAVEKKGTFEIVNPKHYDIFVLLRHYLVRGMKIVVAGRVRQVGVLDR